MRPTLCDPTTVTHHVPLTRLEKQRKTNSQTPHRAPNREKYKKNKEKLNVLSFS